MKIKTKYLQNIQIFFEVSAILDHILTQFLYPKNSTSLRRHHAAVCACGFLLFQGPTQTLHIFGAKFIPPGKFPNQRLLISLHECRAKILGLQKPLSAHYFIAPRYFIWQRTQDIR